MSVYFDRPLGITQRQSKFSSREVGLSHPDLPTFMKFTDNGDVQIMVSDSTGIIISRSRDCIFLVGKVIKFTTNEIKWNDTKFNPYATTFDQPALVKYESTATGDIYENVYDILRE